MKLMEFPAQEEKNRSNTQGRFEKCKEAQKKKMKVETEKLLDRVGMMKDIFRKGD